MNSASQELMSDISIEREKLLAQTVETLSARIKALEEKANERGVELHEKQNAAAEYKVNINSNQNIYV